MKRITKIMSCAMAALMLCLSLAACGSSKKSGEDESYVDKVKVEDTDEVAPIAEGEETELEWLSYFDINPSKNSKEKRVDLDLFEKKGGTF